MAFLPASWTKNEEDDLLPMPAPETPLLCSERRAWYPAVASCIVECSTMKQLSSFFLCSALVASSVAQASDGPAGPDQYICANSVVLSADPLGSGEQGFWSIFSGSGTFSSETSTVTTVSGLSLGENVIQWTILGNGAPVIDQVLIAVFDPNLPASYAGPDSVLCAADPTMLLLADPLPSLVLGTWVVSSGMAQVASPTNPHSAVTLQGSGPATLTWILFNGPCGQTEDEVTLSVQECEVDIPEVSLEAARVLYDASQERIIVAAPLVLDRVEVFDATGRSLNVVKPVSNSIFISMRGRAEGVYLVNLVSHTGSVTRRIAIGR